MNIFRNHIHSPLAETVAPQVLLQTFSCPLRVFFSALPESAQQQHQLIHTLKVIFFRARSRKQLNVHALYLFIIKSILIDTIHNSPKQENPLLREYNMNNDLNLWGWYFSLPWCFLLRSQRVSSLFHRTSEWLFVCQYNERNYSSVGPVPCSHLF